MSQRLKTLSLAAALFAVNAYIVRELFATEYTAQMGSIEASFISLARYAMENWRDLTWFPLWYGGVPYQNTYPPLLHLTVAAVAKLLSISPAHSYHAVTATLYCLGPVTLFWLAWRLTASRAYSFAAGLLYSVFSPAVLLIPAVRNDVGGLFNPRRFQALVQYGEGPHVASMALLPVAILCLHDALEKRQPLRYLLAALSMAAVVLTNWLGGFAMAAAIVAYLLSRSPAWNWERWLSTAAIGAGAFALASPWIPPSTIAAISANSQLLGGNYSIGAQHLKYAGLILIALVLIEFCFERWKPPEFLRFAVLFSFFMGVLTLAAAWLRILLVPQPERYHLEMEMALVLLTVFALKPVFDGMGRGQRALVLAGFLLFAFFQMKTYRTFAKYQGRPIDIRATIEYKAAQWFEANMHGRRVYAPGSVGFWMNAFTDTPQYCGGFEQGMLNPHVPAVSYQVYSGEGTSGNEGEVGALWLKAYGVHAVMTGGPRSGESFKPFRNARKFEGLLKEVWRDGDDAVYELPWRSASLAHAMWPRDMVARDPEGGLDVEPLRPYVAALDNPELPLAEFTWRDRHRATVAAGLQKGQLLSVQMSYHPGWRASVGGQPRRVYRDNLGQLAVAPECEGQCSVDLVYNGGAEMLVTRLLSWTALLAGLLWSYWPAIGRRWRSLPVRSQNCIAQQNQ